MQKTLDQLSKGELISIILDYQEMTFEIESLINSYKDKTDFMLQVRDIVAKWIYKESIN